MIAEKINIKQKIIAFHIRCADFISMKYSATKRNFSPEIIIIISDRDLDAMSDINATITVNNINII